MDVREIKKSIIDLVQKENDVDRLETILRLMENAQRDLGPDDSLLLDSVLIAEREYAEGKGVSLEAARRIMKKGGEQ